ncbi:MAG: hypothetical protein AB9869_03785 [Verrucomicrobiia bacterium]
MEIGHQDSLDQASCDRGIGGHAIRVANACIVYQFRVNTRLRGKQSEVMRFEERSIGLVHHTVAVGIEPCIIGRVGRLFKPAAIKVELVVEIDISVARNVAVIPVKIETETVANLPVGVSVQAPPSVVYQVLGRQRGHIIAIGQAFAWQRRECPRGPVSRQVVSKRQLARIQQRPGA